ncbi:hypothetical protein ACFVJW_08640 [Streptomyces libani]|uniref:hypothetical protein n=1 Tax=Streptomyces nigrescens TaxID=1920 RepID=UPI003634FA80
MTMDAGDSISAVSALVAAAAAVVGWWQAHSARRTVKASEEQVNVMRDQLALERTLRDDSIRPRFEVVHTTAMLLPGGGGRLTVEVLQTTGVPLDEVKVELFAGGRQIVPDESADSVYGSLYSAPGSKFTVRAHLDEQTAQAPAIRVELSGTEARGTRQWAARLVAHPAVTASRLLGSHRDEYSAVTASGLPRRVPRSNLAPRPAEQSWSGGPQVSRAPDDVRGRLSNLRRVAQRRRNAGSDANSQSSVPGSNQRQKPSGVGPGGPATVKGVPPDDAPAPKKIQP